MHALEQRLQHLAAAYPNIDGIVAVAHTEGTVPDANNTDYVLRSLAGFMVHANVGAVLAVDYGWEPVNNEVLRGFLLEQGYPLGDVPHRFLTLKGGFEEGLAEAEAIVTGWLDLVNAAVRIATPLSELKVALQCGGSDAFSGVSANPLIGWIGREAVRHGGYANLTETPELVGAEPYVLDKVKDLATAQRFLAIQTRFKQYAAAHGTSAEGNPSDGNRFRGLYNITLKSIGAAQKKHPDLRLDAAIDYSERMTEPGFYFMDSPGLDLESVAGQVASGCTVVFFTTGNGSVTNFPFVPTIKVVTTTARFRLLQHDMDVNAGAYLDGTPMDELGRQLLDFTVDVASGLRTAGERAGHAQVQIWRNWRQTGGNDIQPLLNRPVPSGVSLPVKAADPLPAIQFEATWTEAGAALQQVGLIVPTSLCAAQVARLAAERLNRKQLGRDRGLSRYVSLVHTEGCTDSTGAAVKMSTPTLLGYATHPSVRHCVLLEHGCEVTHNDYMRRQLASEGVDVSRFGWASVQLDGGIAAVLQKIEEWFVAAVAAEEQPQLAMVGLESLRVGFLAASPLPDTVAASFSAIARGLAAAGGLAVAASDGYLARSAAFVEATLATGSYEPSLAYGHRPQTPGFHIMETPTAYPVEIVTGLGAAGVDIILAYVGRHAIQGHPLVPVLQIATEHDLEPGEEADLDVVLRGDPADWPGQLLQCIADLAAHRHTPRQFNLGNVDFQIARGCWGFRCSASPAYRIRTRI